MKKVNIKQIVCTALIVVFSLFTLLLNFPAGNNVLTEEQKLEIIMEKEAPIIKSLSSYNAETGMVEINGSLQAFKEFRDKVNGGTTFSGVTVKLMDDIDLSSEDNFTPIGNVSSKNFKGIFDGNGHSIKNLTTTATSKVNVGLFGYTNGTTIKNLTITIGTITAYPGYSAGAIAGGAYGKTIIQDCIVMPASDNSSITSKLDTSLAAYSNSLGGIVGYAGTTTSDSLIKQCANYVNITNNATKDANVGGIVGYLRGSDSSSTAARYLTIDSCYSNATLKNTQQSSGNVLVGGIIGGCAASDTTLKINECINESSLAATAIDKGNSDNSSKKSYETGAPQLRKDIKSTNDIPLEYIYESFWHNYIYNIYAGGILGYTASSNASISNCFNLTNTSNINIPNDSYTNDIDYFYGRRGDKFSDNSIYEPQYYGDYLDIYYYQYISNYREIAHGGAITNCYAFKASNYYSTSSGYSVYERVYSAKITGVEDQKLTFNHIGIENALSGLIGFILDTVLINDFTPTSTTVTLYLGKDQNNNNIYLPNVSANVYEGAYVYGSVYDTNGNLHYGWIKNDVYNCYNTTYKNYQLGLNYVTITNHSNLMQIYQPVAYLNSDSTTPYYNQTYKATASLGNTYTSPISAKLKNTKISKITHQGHTDYSNNFYNEKGKLIYDTKISKGSTDSSTKKFAITHDFKYDYDGNGGTWGYTDASSTNSIEFCKVDDKTISNTINFTKLTSNTMYSTIMTNSMTLSNGKPTFRWMYWNNNYDNPTN